MQALRQIVEQAGFPQDHGTAPHEPEAENTSPGLAKDESYKKLGEQPSEPPMTAKILEPEVALGPEVPVVDTLPKLPQGEASSRMHHHGRLCAKEKQNLQILKPMRTKSAR